jgi:phage/plasmid-associated DNA primase
MIWVGVGANGKGTTWEVMRQLVGEHSAGAFTLHQFARDFGLSPLVNKMVAYCGEAELKGQSDRNRILETLKGITGEDPQQVNVKFDPDGKTMTLPTRLVIACNRLPTLYETTGAVSRRMLLQRFDQCFEGREDFALKGKLCAELAGIANWALQGLRRLRANGRFSMATAMTEAVNDYRRDNSPEYAFTQDRLMVSRAVNPGNLHGVTLTDDDGITANKTAVESAYRKWCEENDIEFDETKFRGWFWRSINDIMPRMRDKGRHKGHGENRIYRGIALKATQGGAA